eukprot:scaffold284_cov127-Isochrysis_galbana.AAC.2
MKICIRGKSASSATSKSTSQRPRPTRATSPRPAPGPRAHHRVPTHPLRDPPLLAVGGAQPQDAPLRRRTPPLRLRSAQVQPREK